MPQNDDFACTFISEHSIIKTLVLASNHGTHTSQETHPICIHSHTGKRNRQTILLKCLCSKDPSNYMLLYLNLISYFSPLIIKFSLFLMILHLVPTTMFWVFYTRERRNTHKRTHAYSIHSLKSTFSKNYVFFPSVAAAAALLLPPPATIVVCGEFSFLAASCNNSVSTSPLGICIYLTTLPRIKQFRNAINCGYFSLSTTLTSVSLTFKY
mmetsp:Transcript_8277/g.12168  ORF Transcript_8277/g.12168 Transcript_8277/m.12168 type:complete len:211 (+) Transcript_8277:58-690(+)